MDTETSPTTATVTDLSTRLPFEQIPVSGQLFVHEPLIETLEMLLDKARKGEIKGIAYASVKHDDSLSSGWDGAAQTKQPLAAAIMALHGRYSDFLWK